MALLVELTVSPLMLAAVGNTTLAPAVPAVLLFGCWTKKLPPVAEPIQLPKDTKQKVSLLLLSFGMDRVTLPVVWAAVEIVTVLEFALFARTSFPVRLPAVPRTVCTLLVSTVSRLAPAEFWTWKAVVELELFCSNAVPPSPIVKAAVPPSLNRAILPVEVLLLTTKASPELAPVKLV